jgi:hypothetical protein
MRPRRRTGSPEWFRCISARSSCSSGLPHVSHEVTIEHLLTHTSGIGDYYDEDVVTDFTNFQVAIPW